MYFHYSYLYGHARAQDPCPEGRKIYYFGRPFLGHRYYILNLSDQCPGVEKMLPFIKNLRDPGLRTWGGGVMVKES